MRKRVAVVANWKLNPPSLEEAKALFAGTKRAFSGAPWVEGVVCPPLPFLGVLSQGRHAVSFGAQDASCEVRGAFTGEVSAEILRSAGAAYAIVGHSERRARGESDTDVSKKAYAALDARVVPIVCVGERERDAHGNYLSALARQLLASLERVPDQLIAKVVVAYEPVWAIGERSQGVITPRDLHEVVIFIRKTLSERYDRSRAEKVRVLYGGSVDETNAHALLAESGASGLLLGRVSLDPEALRQLIRSLKSDAAKR
jgi:triosephosphate isomerase